MGSARICLEHLTVRGTNTLKGTETLAPLMLRVHTRVVSPSSTYRMKAPIVAMTTHTATTTA